MADRTHEQVIELVISALRQYGQFLRRNEGTAGDTGDYLSAIRDGDNLYRMLRKLNDGAILEMYNNCRILALKYELAINNSMPVSVTMHSPMYADDSFYLEKKNSDGVTVGWGYGAPQAKLGYTDHFDQLANEMGFDIHGTKFTLRGGYVLCLWKGFYGGCIGGEIGLYGPSEKVKYEDINKKLWEALERFLEIVEARAVVKDLMNLSIDELEKRLVEFVLNAKKVMPYVKDEAVKEALKMFLLTSLIPGVMPKMAFLGVFFSMATIAFIMRALNTIKFIIAVYKDMDKELKEGLTYSEEWGEALDSGRLGSELGLAGTAVQVYYKRINHLIAERREFQPRFWMTAFEISLASMPEFLFQNIDTKDFLYTVNHFYFSSKEFADRFHAGVIGSLGEAHRYPDNKGETISAPDRPNENTVIIYYGG